MMGKTLGHYQITGKLGEGGMGVVYKAQDLHLDRSVAIKILPPEKVADAERKQRFVREAKAASALNHPNIVTIHDIDQADGIDYIAMEHVAGKTLDQRIGHRGLRLNDALKYAVQIADALAKAHSTGIIHRDLKPTNVIVTEDGAVKVLDFGLAKLADQIQGDEFTSTATVDVEGKPITEAGTIVGTVSYMSPEQAEGKKVDARSDIFSLGSLLYEMVTGRQAFHGDSKLSTLAAIIDKEPKELPADVPHDLEKVISRCLRKDPARRFQGMADVKVALEELKEESDSGRLSAPAAVKPRSKWAWFAAAAAVVMILAGVVAAWKSLRPAAPPAPALKRLTHDVSSFIGALSPDGKLLAYCRSLPDKPDSDIWLQQVDGGRPVRLTDDPADDLSPAFSPDGTSIVFRSSRRGGGIFVMPALGGEARQIAPDGFFPVFSPDGSEVAYVSGTAATTTTRRIQIVPAVGGNPTVFRPDLICHLWPIWSPDGSQILFLGSDGKQRGWIVAPRSGGEPKWIDLGSFQIQTARPWQWIGGKDRKTPEWFAVSTMASGVSVLYRVPVSSAGVINGKPEQLASVTHAIAFPSFSAVGRIVFSGLDGMSNLWDLPLDANSGRLNGPARRITSGRRAVAHSISRNGTRVVFATRDRGGSEVVLKDLNTGTERVLASSTEYINYPSISPDGTQVVYPVFARQAQGPTELHLVPSDGGAGRLLSDNGGTPNGWLPDGSGVLYHTGRPSTMFLIDIATGKRTELLRHPTDGLFSASFSADGAWITFHQRPRPGHVRLLAAPYRDGKAGSPDQWVVMVDETFDNDKPLLSPDGGTLYFQSKRDGFICVWSQRLDPKTKQPIGQPEAVQHYHGTVRSVLTVSGAIGYELHLSLAADRMIVNLDELQSDLWMLDTKE